jgi:catechol 2,3-dioxygenase-like lactoylglutathione lyase family enzyme
MGKFYRVIGSSGHRVIKEHCGAGAARLSRSSSTRAKMISFTKEVTMAIIGAHALLYSTEPEKLRATLRDVFGWKHVDAGDGWLIFALPPAELGVHPSEGPTYESGVRHQISFMCDDIKKTIRELRAKGIEVKDEPEDEGYGITVMLGLPGGVEVMLYEPRHAMAITTR